MQRFAAPDVLIAIAIGAVALVLAYVALAHPRGEQVFIREAS